MPLTLLAFAAIYLIWGSTFLAIRVAVASIPPLLMMGIRCSTAGVLLLTGALIQGERITVRACGDAIIAGGLMFGVAYGALAWAEQELASGMTALLVATVPIWLVLIEWRQRGVAPSGRIVAGLALGLAGVALLVGRGIAGSVALAPMAVVLGGELAWAAGTLYAKPRLPKALALNAGLPLTAGGLLLLVLAYTAGEVRRFDPHAVSPRSLAALAYLTVFGSIVAFSAYSWLMRVAPAARVGTHAYVNPLIALILGTAVAGEPITATIVIAAVVIAAGVAVIGSSKEGTAPSRKVGRPVAEPALSSTADARAGDWHDERISDQPRTTGSAGEPRIILKTDDCRLPGRTGRLVPLPGQPVSGERQ